MSYIWNQRVLVSDLYKSIDNNKYMKLTQIFGIHLLNSSLYCKSWTFLRNKKNLDLIDKHWDGNYRFYDISEKTTLISPVPTSKMICYVLAGKFESLYIIFDFRPVLWKNSTFPIKRFFIVRLKYLAMKFRFIQTAYHMWVNSFGSTGTEVINESIWTENYYGWELI